MTTQPFKYTDRDYLSLRDQMIKYIQAKNPDWVPPGATPDPSDFAALFIEASAYMGDLLSYYVDRAAQEATPLTANSPTNVLAWAALFGLTPALAQSAEVELTLTTESSSPVEVKNRTMVRSTTGYQFEIMVDPSIGDTVTVSKDTPVTVTAWEGSSVWVNGFRGREVGVSNGFAGQEYALPETFVDRRGLWVDVYQDTLDGYVSTGAWEFTSRLLDHGPEDRVFGVRTAPDGKVSVVFGDGVSGAVPPTGYRIKVYYRVTSGAVVNLASSVPPRSITMIDTSWDQDSASSLANVKVTNYSTPSGGVDPETIDNIKQKTVQVARSQRRAVTAQDYENAAMMNGDVLTAHCSAKVWSRPTVFVLPRSQVVLTQPTRRKEFLDGLRADLEALSVVGTSPDVFTGLPTPLNAKVTAYAMPNVRQSAIKSAIESVLLNQFTYENLRFDTTVSSSDLTTQLHLSLPAKMVKYVYCQLEPVYPDQPVILEPDDPEPVPVADQRYGPRLGELLYIDKANLTVVINGGIQDI